VALLLGKVAIVTGTNKGMGKAISVVLAHKGDTIILAACTIVDLQDTADLASQAQENFEIAIAGL
jgi:NAD(P)-dependent dehydrogenase (short-subunit alcohol dehydrogenase family)